MVETLAPLEPIVKLLFTSGASDFCANESPLTAPGVLQNHSIE